MPRQPRAQSKSGIPHVIARGIGRQLLFESDWERNAPIESIGSLPRAERDAALVKLKRLGVSIRQAERLTGIGRKIVATAFASDKNR